MLIKIFLSIIITAVCFTSAAHAQNSQKFRFAVIGCGHISSMDEIGSLDYIADAVRSLKAEFVITLGGMLDPYHSGPADKLCEEYNKAVKKFGVPVFDVVSNCQFYPDYTPSEALETINRNFLSLYKKRNYSYIHKNSLFLFIDPERMELPEEAKNMSRFDHVFLSVSRLPVPEIDIIPPDDKFKTLLADDKIGTVFHSTVHKFDIRHINGTTFALVGSPINDVPNMFALEKPAMPHILIVDADGKKVSFSLIPLIPPDTVKPVTKLVELNNEMRMKIFPPERIIEALNIKKGLSVVDIGAGSGIFTFGIADALQGTGQVFATEADTAMIEHLNAVKNKNGYKNVTPVFVDPKGLDPFYKSRVFDIIFVSETYSGIPYPEEYFKSLKTSLKKGSGRVFIINFRLSPDFMDLEFGNFKKTVFLLSKFPDSFPIKSRLNRETLDFVNNWKGESVPSNIQKNIVDDLNVMLNDRLLFDSLMDFYAHDTILSMERWFWCAPLVSKLPLEQHSLVKWLVLDLQKKDVFAPHPPADIKKHRDAIRKLNRVLITSLIRTKALEDVSGRFVPHPEKESVVATLARAGYSLVKEHVLTPPCFFLEFKRKD